jgi:pyruvate,water dikinase
MAAMGLASVPHARFLAFCQRHLGPDADLRAMTMLEGLASEHTSAGDALAALGRSAEGNPALIAALAGGDLEAVRKAPAGEGFAAEFEALLQTYGRGVHTFFATHLPRWEEEPATPLRLIARYAAQPGSSPLAAHARSSERRAAAIAAAEEELAPAGELAEFHALLEGAAGYVQVIEERAHWQLSLMGAARTACLALGRRLAANALIEAANDVFLLHLHEIEEYAAGKAPLPSLAEQRDRSAALLRWRDIRPPATLGQPLPAGIMRDSAFSKIFGVCAPRVSGETISGAAASMGIATGRARIALDLESADALEPGEILVVPFTSPPWTPFFSLAAAVVTDAGGVLSHAAIEAREYGIPAVVGTQVATRLIPTGALVEVDGSAGTVRIVSR